MSKVRSVFIILLALALIALCGFFPKLVSYFLDQSRFWQSERIPIQPVQLEIRQELSALGKLAVMARWDLNFEIPDSKTAMSRQQVSETAEKLLSPYLETLLIPSFGEIFEMRANLFQIQDDPEMQVTVWLVSAVCDPPDAPQQYTSLDLAIDDSTGKLLAIHYTTEEAYDLCQDRDSLRVFADIFFSGLGIPDYGQYLALDLEYAGETGSAVRYCIPDPDCGEIAVELYVHAHGFYIGFPEH